jgi:hypothetical protein
MQQNIYTKLFVGGKGGGTQDGKVFRGYFECIFIYIAGILHLQDHSLLWEITMMTET